MWREQSSPVFLIVIAASVAAHAGLLAVLPPADAAVPAPRAKTMVTFETTPLPSPPPPMPVEVAQEPTVEQQAARSPAPRTSRPAPRRPAPAPRTQAAPAPSPEVPVDFSGVTLSNDGASWASPGGSGEPLTAPIAVSAPAPQRGPLTRAPASGTGDRVVAVGDLSRPPRAPDLDAALAANYPDEARRAGLAGKAVVRARILADGSVGAMRVVSETAAGFGVACKRTLTGSRWQAPLDANERPVITDINYTCRFAVAR